MLMALDASRSEVTQNFCFHNRNTLRYGKGTLNLDG